jgi:L-alanine-DL-glutamate epimerase-like enolase superfamily enzyme
MATIRQIRTAAITIPLDSPIAFARRQVAERHYLVLRLEADDGSTGIGFCYAGHAGSSVAAEAVRVLLAPVVIGADADRIAGIWQRMHHAALLHGRAGIVTRAMSAIDIALWDRQARAAGLPLWKLLGGVADGAVPAYASGGYYAPDKTADDLAQETASYVAAGFSAVKIKVGRAELSEDTRRIAAVREAVGPATLLMLDANNAWSHLTEARRALRQWEAFDPYWIEEPFEPDDMLNHARLVRASNVPVATGEIEAGLSRHRLLAEQGAADILQTDAAVCGGVTEWMRIAAMANAFGLGMAPHWFHDLHVHLVAAVPNALFVEYFPDDSVLNFRRLLDRQLGVANGYLQLPPDPGLGFDFDDNQVSRHSLNGWQ